MSHPGLIARILVLFTAGLPVHAGCSLLHWDGSNHYLLDEANQPVLIWGHYYPGVIGSANTEADYDVNLYKTLCTTYNMNCIRLWDGDAANGVGFRYHPWVRNGGAAPDGGLKFDQTTLDLAGYFNRLTNVVAQMDSINVYCVVMLLNGFCGDITNRFSTNRFYTGMNVNLHVLTTNDWFTMNDTTWVGYMTNTARVFCDYLQPYKNVLLEVAGNEMPTRSTNLNYYLAKYVKDYEATLPRQHPIVISSMSGQMANSDTYQTNLIVSSNVGSVFTPPNKAGTWQNNPPRVTSTYVQVIDTDHTYGNVGTISNMLQTLTRGYGGYLNLESNYWHPNALIGDNTRASIGYIRDFAKRMNLTTAQPSNNYSSSGYALTNTFGQTLVFAPTNANYIVTHPPGWLRWRWLDPELGIIKDQLYLETASSDTWATPSEWTTKYGMLLLEPTTGAAGVEFGVSTNDYIDCGSISGTTGDLTLSAWIMLNTNSLSTSQLNIMANGGSWLIVDHTRLDFSSAVKDNYGATNAIVNPYQWYHVAGTRTGSTYKLYVNGVQSGGNVTDAGSTTPSFNFFIGSNGTHNLSWVGWIRDCQMYGRALSDTEIYALSNGLGPNNTTSLIGYWPLTDFAQGAAVDTLVFKDRSGKGWNGTAHKGTGGAMVQRLGGPQLVRR